MEIDDEYSVDEEDLIAGSGNSQIELAYIELFDQIRKIADDGTTSAKASNPKGISNAVTRLSKVSAGLSQLTQLDAKIIGPTGQIFNVFGQESSGDSESEEITDEDLATRIRGIVDGNTSIGFRDAAAEIAESAKNIEDDGLSHGDLDDFKW